MALAETAILMILLSPVKKLDYLSPFTSIKHTRACCLTDLQVLFEQLSTYVVPCLTKPKHLNKELVQLKFEPDHWPLPNNLDNAKPAMYAKLSEFCAKKVNSLSLGFARRQDIHRLEQVLAFSADAYVYNPSLTQQAHQPVLTLKTF